MQVAHILRRLLSTGNTGNAEPRCGDKRVGGEQIRLVCGFRCILLLLFEVFRSMSEVDTGGSSCRFFPFLCNYLGYLVGFNRPWGCGWSKPLLHRFRIPCCLGFSLLSFGGTNWLLGSRCEVGQAPVYLVQAMT